jgi:hypothetical protein
MPAVGISRSVIFNVQALVGIERVVVFQTLTAVEIDRTVLFNVLPPAVLPVQPLPASDPCTTYGFDNPFRRVFADYLIDGGARVFWELRPQFYVPLPQTFQLQVGSTADQAADDWQPVGLPVVNTFTASDPTRRALGKQLTVHYRVQVIDGNGNVWLSPASTVMGQMGVREWLWARDLIRRETLRLRKWAGLKGFLLKRRRDGPACLGCIDPETNSVIDSQCPVCFGSRFLGGYFTAVPCQLFDTGNASRSELRQTDSPKGTVADVVMQGRVLGTIQLVTNDVWVDTSSDLRYWIEEVSVPARIRGVPIIQEIKLSQFSLSDVIYNLQAGVA